MRSSFDQAFEFVVGHEGGYTADRRDRGNWTSGKIGVGQLKGTKFGVSAMSYPDLDIKNLTVEDAKAIYLKDYWEKVRSDDLPVGVDYLVFDIAVNHGVRDAIQWLQLAAGTNPDGVFGPQTLAAVQRRDPLRLIEEIGVTRQMDYIALKSWPTYGKGWTRRGYGVVVRATIMHQATLDQSKVEAPVEELESRPGLLGGLFRRRAS